MGRRNRVDPWGDLHAVSARGTFTGNRGCLVNDAGEVVRHHRGNAWIVCRLEYRGWKHPLDHPRTWTPVFFLDEATAFAAGHRPCALCRRDAFNSYRSAIAAAEGLSRPPSAKEIDARLATERLDRGRGIERAEDRRTWMARSGELPAGTVILANRRHPARLGEDGFRAFTFGGWDENANPISTDWLEVLTPPTSVAALRGGYRFE
jgi:hypothetical protein